MEDRINQLEEKLNKRIKLLLEPFGDLIEYLEVSVYGPWVADEDYDFEGNITVNIEFDITNFTDYCDTIENEFDCDDSDEDIINSIVVEFKASLAVINEYCEKFVNAYKIML